MTHAPTVTQRVIIASSIVAVVAFSVWAAWTRHRAALSAGVFPTGEALVAQRKKFGRELRYCNALGARDRESCLENRALEAREAFFCGEIPDLDARDRCLSAFVFNVGVSPPCEAISQPVARAECLADAAGTYGELQACKTLTSQRAKLVGRCTDDAKGCASTIDALVAACLAMADGDISRCPAGPAGPACRIALAARRRDPALCPGDQAQVAACRRTIAIRAREPKLCGPIGDSLADECRDLIARRRGLTDCNPLELECRGRKAVVAGGAPALCEGDARCALYVAYRTKRSDVCSLVVGDEAHAACLDLGH